MQDPRIRTGIIIYLSLCAMLSVGAALYVFCWWALAAVRHPDTRTLTGMRWILLFTGCIALLIWWTGGDAISYFTRITAVLFIASFLYHDQKDNDLLDVSVWLAKNRIGFEIGLIAEMTLGTIRLIKADILQIRTAMQMKNQRFSLSTVPAVISLELFTLLYRAMQQGDLLQTRGYIRGGTYIPVFQTTRGDIILALLAVPAAFFLIFPLQDLF